MYSIYASIIRTKILCVDLEITILFLKKRTEKNSMIVLLE